MIGHTARLDDPDRLEALQRALLIDTPSEQVFDQLSDLVRTLLSAPVALISIVDDSRQFFKSCVGVAEPVASERGTPLSHSFCQHVVITEAPLIVADAREDARVQGNEAIADMGVVAYAGWPLHAPGGEILGSVCAIDARPRDWTAEELASLERIAGIVDEVVRIRQLALSDEVRREGEAQAGRDEALEARAVASLSRRLQRGLLPRALDGDLEGRVHIAYHPGSERLLLGGDFLDVRRDADGAVSFVVGDVCGHGPEAAALAVALRSSWASLHRVDVDVGETVRLLNEIALREQAEEALFVTVLTGSFDPAGRLEVVSAGHPMPLALGADPHELELPFGLPLGLVDDATWEPRTIDLGDGGLLAYTDGLVEGFAGTGDRERFGTGRLLAAIATAAADGTPPDRLAETLVDVAREANGAPLSDDVAVLYLERP